MRVAVLITLLWSLAASNPIKQRQIHMILALMSREKYTNCPFDCAHNMGRCFSGGRMTTDPFHCKKCPPLRTVRAFTQVDPTECDIPEIRAKKAGVPLPEDNQWNSGVYYMRQHYMILSLSSISLSLAVVTLCCRSFSKFKEKSFHTGNYSPASASRLLQQRSLSVGEIPLTVSPGGSSYVSFQRNPWARKTSYSGYRPYGRDASPKQPVPHI